MPPKGAPNILLIMTDDQGYGIPSAFGGVVPTPGLDRIARAGLRYHNSINITLLVDAGGAYNRTQPSRRRVRRHCRAVNRLPGYDFVIGPENATIGTILKQNGYATSWFGKNHNAPGFQYSMAGPFDQWPIGMGFEYFYGFNGGETNQWTPYLFQNMTQIFPWVGKKAYDAWGSAQTYPHMAVAWAWAFDTPFKGQSRWHRTSAAPSGHGYRLAKPHQGCRGHPDAVHHMIDIVPTILEATGIHAPVMVNGIAQKPIEGVSTAYTFDKANARSFLGSDKSRKCASWRITEISGNPSPSIRRTCKLAPWF